MGAEVGETGAVPLGDGDGSGVNVELGCEVAVGSAVLVGRAVNVSAIHVEDKSLAVASNWSALKLPGAQAESKKNSEENKSTRVFFNVMVLEKELFLQ